MKEINNGCGKKKGCAVDDSGLAYDDAPQPLYGGSGSVFSGVLRTRNDLRTVRHVVASDASAKLAA